MRFLSLLATCLILTVAADSQVSRGPRSLPRDARGPVSAVLGKDDSTYWVFGGSESFRGENIEHSLTTDFSKRGAMVQSHNLHWQVVTCAYGYGDDLRPLKPVAPQAKANRVEYLRNGLNEWYENGPLGLEQGFTLAYRPGRTNGQPLTLALAMRGDLVATVRARGTGLDLRSKDGRIVLRYTDLSAWDATGRELRSRLEVRGQRLLVRVNDSGARYPVMVDPWIQQAELTSSDGAADDQFANSVAISGSTLVVGAPFHTVGSNAWQGAAYVFVQNGTTWSQQAELTASDGGPNDKFGSSVAVSGGTVVVGAPQHLYSSQPGPGAAYVFVQSGTNWSQQAELTPPDGAAYDEFGFSVAVSGSTAVVGAYEHKVSNPSQGAAYVFVQSGTNWSQQAELTAPDGGFGDQFGQSVAVSGSTAVVGAPAHTVGSNYEQGAAYVFTDSGGIWVQQAELTASDGGFEEFFASSVAISGSTAVAASPEAAYVFSQVGEVWNQQAELAIANFSGSVAIDDGAIVAGAPVYQQVAYVFVENGGTWSQETQLTASDGASTDLFGYSVAISGHTVVVGAPNHEIGLDRGQGAAYVFVPPAPTVTLFPSSLSFGEQAVNTTSTPRTVALENTGTATLKVGKTAVTLGTEFTISGNTCGTTLTPGKICKVSVTFAPTGLGATSGTLSFTDNASNSPQAVPLSGAGVAQATIAPDNLSFGKQTVGTTSGVKSVILKNNLPTTLTGISYSTNGPFAVTATTCGTALNSKASCTFSVTFTPLKTGATTGKLSVSDSANNSPQNVSLAGTGD